MLVGAGSIYRIVPCSEEAARIAIERSASRPLKIVELPPGKTLAAPVESRNCTCCGGNPEDGHEDGCPNEYEDDGATDAL